MKRGRKSKVWTEDSEKFLREHFDSMSAKQIAEILHTTRQNVNGKARKLGLRKTEKNWKLTKSVKDVILKMYRTSSYKAIAEKLHISDSSVYLYIKKLSKEDPTFKKRTSEESGRIVSENRLRLLKVERAYAAFGMPQKTSVKLTRCNKKSWLRYLLRKTGSYEVDYGCDEVYIINEKKRKKALEHKAVKLGFDFYEPVGEEGEMTVYEKIKFN